MCYLVSYVNQRVNLKYKKMLTLTTTMSPYNVTFWVRYTQFCYLIQVFYWYLCCKPRETVHTQLSHQAISVKSSGSVFHWIQTSILCSRKKDTSWNIYAPKKGSVIGTCVCTRNTGYILNCLCSQDRTQWFRLLRIYCVYCFIKNEWLRFRDGNEYQNQYSSTRSFFRSSTRLLGWFPVIITQYQHRLHATFVFYFNS
jgi:hypothetical protein